MTMEWLDQHFEEKDGFPRPDWKAIYDAVDASHKHADQQTLWCDIARAWLQRLASKLPAQYRIHESDNFILLTSEDDRYVSAFQTFLENTLRRILSSLRGIASDDGYGKYVVLIFDDIDSYYAYISYFYAEEGVYGLSSGTYLNKGYGHFVFPHQDIAYAESIAAHELTHALLVHLPVPAWLNEGMAVSIEHMLTGSAPLRMDNAMQVRHQSFWHEQGIQGFWSGDAFHSADEGQELSYHLAQLAVNALSKNYDSFRQFVNAAHYRDGGEAAAAKVYSEGLGNLVAHFFGEGDWTPRPEAWPDTQAEKPD